MRIMVCLKLVIRIAIILFISTVLVMEVKYRLEVSGSGNITSAGFLFLCPPSDLQEGISRAPFHASECAAYYWSLDPKGVQRLNTEETTNLGLPSITVKIDVEGYSWDRTRVASPLSASSDAAIWPQRYAIWSI
jgi:hypothetical protein